MIGPRSLFRILVFKVIMKLRLKMMSGNLRLDQLHAGVDPCDLCISILQRGTSGTQNSASVSIKKRGRE